MSRSSAYPPREGGRAFQAKVHFALGTIIQGVTLGALGSEVASMLRELPGLNALWAFGAAVLSLAMCILFWFRFMDNYYFGFRAVEMTAGAHLLLAGLHMVLGLGQLVAIRVLDVPRLWFAAYVFVLGATIGGGVWVSRVVRVQEEEARQALEFEPGSKGIHLAFALAGFLLVLWFAVPSLDSAAMRWGALGSAALGLSLFAIHSLQVFERHRSFEGEVGP